jgi:alanine racemase
MLSSSDRSNGELRIDLAALAENFRNICAHVLPSQVAGVVKANGYGLGTVRVAKTLADAGCQHFFVANLNEAVELRPHLSRDCAIYVLNGL